MNTKFKRVYSIIKKAYRKNKKIHQEDYKRILSYGFSQMAFLLLRGHDILIQEKAYDNPFVIGEVQPDYDHYVRYYRKKLINKMHVLDYRSAQKTNKNYYYFSLGAVKYRKYMRSPKKNGKYFFQGKITFYHLLEECIIDTDRTKRIFRVEFPLCYNLYKFSLYNFSSNDAELILYRPKTTRHRMIVEYKNMCVRYGYRSKHF